MTTPADAAAETPKASSICLTSSEASRMRGFLMNLRFHQFLQTWFKSATK